MVMGPPPGPPPGAAGPGALSQEKACQILAEGAVNGQPLTPAQERLMQAICSGQVPVQARHGALVVHGELQRAYMEVNAEDPEFVSGLATERSK